jgi:cytochrome bd ubiquinol oxidase subunit II
VIAAGVALVALWLGISAYALLGGADFGGGFWDLLAGGPERGARQRALIEHSIGPVWEANHVWLIFALVVLWTSFPPAFAAVASTLYVPLTLVALGVIFRGAAFAFRKTVTEVPLKRAFGAAFAASSVVTPFFLGAVAGAIASGRVPPGIARGSVIRSWVNPTSVFVGLIAVGVCAYLAAVYLTADARRQGQIDLAEAFRRRGMWTGVVVGAVVMAGVFVLRADAPFLYHRLLGRALPLVIASALFGLASLALLWRRAYLAVRLTAAAAVVSVLWGWGVAQYPYLLPGSLTVARGAAPTSTLIALETGLGVGAILFVPSLVYLLLLFQRERRASEDREGLGTTPA